MNRRFFIQTSTAAATTPLLALNQTHSAELVDVNFATGKWPFRELPKLNSEALKQRGIMRATGDAAYPQPASHHHSLCTQQQDVHSLLRRHA